MRESLLRSLHAPSSSVISSTNFCCSSSMNSMIYPNSGRSVTHSICPVYQLISHRGCDRNARWELFKEGRVYLSSQFVGTQSMTAGRGQQEELEVAGHIVSTVRKVERDACWDTVHLCFFPVQDPRSYKGASHSCDGSFYLI